MGELNPILQSLLDPEDYKALDDGVNTLMQQRFTEKVMEELIDPKKSVKDLWGQTAISSAITTPELSSLTLETSKHIKAHIATLEEIKKEYEPKQYRTLFGRLFNYQ